MSVRIAVVTKGHPFEAEPFFAVFDEMVGVEWTHVEHPAALALVDPERAEAFDVMVMYDMPGITFTGDDPPVTFHAPPPEYAERFEALLDAGMPMVFMHHAIAGWPAWDRYADIIGGRFHYQPASLRGVEYPDSGYRHDVTHQIDVLDPGHPVCAGLDSTFELTDEVYLFPVFEDDVTPLMRSRHSFVDDGFYSADRAIRGTRNSADGWTHPPGSNLVAWTKQVSASTLVYLQFGDGPETYADANFRRVLSNAIRWAARSSTP